MQDTNNIYEEIAIRHALVDQNTDVPDVEAELARFHNEYAPISRTPKRWLSLRNIASFALGMAAMLACVLLYKPVADMLTKSGNISKAALANAEISLVADDGSAFAIGSIADEQRLLKEYGITVYPDGKIAMPSISQEDAKVTNLTITTKRQKECHVVMSDGTEIWMNGNTTLTAPSLFARNKRDVRLAGEAYFKVAKDEKRVFSVYTETTVTQVTGTEFFVQCYPGEESVVTLVKGSVKTSNLITKSVTELEPGNRMKVATDGKESLDITSNKTYAEPMGEYFCFDNEPVSVVVRELARWYGYGMRVENTQNSSIRLYFEARKDGSVDDAISLLNGLSSAKVEISDSILIVR